MKSNIKKALAVLLTLCMAVSTIFMPPGGTKKVKAAETKIEYFTQNGYELTIIQTVGEEVSSTILEQVKNIYFTQYPKMRKRYNTSRPRALTIIFDPTYDGVAYTLGTKIVISTAWLQSNPNDTDCATHEIFHFAQGGYMNYNSESFEGAICEGMADYARSVYGLYNDASGWSLGEYDSSQTITTRYRSNARFLTWLNQRKNSTITYMINKTMHEGTYTDALWSQLTGKTADALWNEYASDPDITKIALSANTTESFGITSGETYKVISAESGMAMSVQNQSTENGANIQQETYTGDESQQWVFNYIGDGMYNIINKKSGKGLDVADGSTANGANIQQYAVENNGNNNQRWIVYERGGEYVLFPVCGNGTMVADLTSSSHNAGANIQLYGWNKTKAQSFVIEPVNGVSENPASRTAFSKIEAEDFTTYNTSVIVSLDESSSRSGGMNIGGLLSGVWTMYKDVKFDSDSDEIEINYCNPSADSYVNVYLDSMSSTPVGTIQTPNNSSDWSTYSTVTGKLSTKIPAGTHNIYLEFKNSANSGYAQNCDYIQFNEYVNPRDAFSKIEAEENDAYDGIINYTNDGYIGNTEKDEWVRYDSVKFSKTAQTIKLRYAVRGDQAGGTVSVYLDNMNSTPVEILELKQTAASDWNTYTETEFNLDTDIAEGTHSVYLKFTPNDGKLYVGNIDWMQFGDTEVFEIKTSSDIKIEGYQLSTTLGGNRVVGSVEPEINGKTVQSWGLIYGLAKANGTGTGISDDDLYVGSDNGFVKAYQSTSLGTIDTQIGTSATAKYFVRTMLFAANTAAAFNAEYKVRAYAVLSDGSYVYSNVSGYSIFSVADYLYANCKMKNQNAHNYLYNNILKVVDSSYSEVDYEWGNSIVKPDETE